MTTLTASQHSQLSALRRQHLADLADETSFGHPYAKTGKVCSTIGIDWLPSHLFERTYMHISQRRIPKGVDEGMMELVEAGMLKRACRKQQLFDRQYTFTATGLAYLEEHGEGELREHLPLGPIANDVHRAAFDLMERADEIQSEIDARWQAEGGGKNLRAQLMDMLLDEIARDNAGRQCLLPSREEYTALLDAIMLRELSVAFAALSFGADVETQLATMLVMTGSPFEIGGQPAVATATWVEQGLARIEAQSGGEYQVLTASQVGLQLSANRSTLRARAAS
jgi:hypothetical protein